ncbi:hypothetical protein FEM48_Zijuj09G0121500 [Ziziphus jujuba var. spinosa]|uniref:Uncharacterized protein n=1 Tax=Ziziphus jujuba var. spinosa TaxID=714518 RepID=A0A978USX5_ZIZJJ|nr:hypothetical protein FEM48_Zijuj09G0121500 [Ziziphus jujuba var. spinosa]
MASLMAIRRARSKNLPSFFNVRPLYPSHFTSIHDNNNNKHSLQSLAKTLSTSAMHNEYQRSPRQQPPHPSDTENPNQWTSQGEGYPQSQSFNNQFNYQNQNRNQNLNYPNRDQNYPNRGHPNPYTSQSYPQYQNANQVNPRTSNYQQPPRNPNQWNNQNQGYPHRGSDHQWPPQVQNPDRFSPQVQNPNRFSPQVQNPNQWNNHQASNQVQATLNQTPNVVPPSVEDLRRLCREGKLKEAIELMDKEGVKADADCFHTLFELCGKSKSLENAKKEMDHYLGLLGVLGKCGHLNEAEEYIHKLPFEPTVAFWEALRDYARIHGDIDLEDHAEELIVALDPSKAVANKITTPPPKKRTAISMLHGKNRIGEFKNPTLYKDDEKLKALSGMKEAGYVPDTRYVI